MTLTTTTHLRQHLAKLHNLLALLHKLKCRFRRHAPQSSARERCTNLIQNQWESVDHGELQRYLLTEIGTTTELQNSQLSPLRRQDG